MVCTDKLRLATQSWLFRHHSDILAASRFQSEHYHWSFLQPVAFGKQTSGRCVQSSFSGVCLVAKFVASMRPLYPALSNLIWSILFPGYYRVNYDETNWKLLASYLNTSSYTNISPLNRAHLIYDAFTLARSGRLSYKVALELTNYLHRETDYIPLYAFFSVVGYFNQMFAGATNYTLFEVGFCLFFCFRQFKGLFIYLVIWRRQSVYRSKQTKLTFCFIANTFFYSCFRYDCLKLYLKNIICRWLVRHQIIVIPLNV